MTSSSRRVTLSTTSETPASASFTTPIFEYKTDWLGIPDSSFLKFKIYRVHVLDCSTGYPRGTNLGCFWNPWKIFSSYSSECSSDNISESISKLSLWLINHDSWAIFTQGLFFKHFRVLKDFRFWDDFLFRLYFMFPWTSPLNQIIQILYLII